ncbi:TetR/AcrR family transcriptional regulator [Microbulbifer thermotolerans]|uniref:TetR/AcrR family transcriptional regulator n=1 Tax=Microbulbifer thermotolerans TaxID=252514 RepID=UPI00224A51EE|nr:TetR/AcrR family transcriptional regulator [Microbulbifer thermotolerans]MCX2784559.1 TetR/AcrR family transcriptional regulator [Microbulbifer thermotolerans]
MTERKPTRSEMKHRAILDAAKRTFRELGIQGTSMDELAARAQVSKRTVYNHFASKEALIMELIAELWQQATLTAEHAYDPQAKLLPQLSTLIEAEIATISSHDYIELNRMAFEYFFHRPEALRAELEKFSAVETGIKRWIKAARTDGRLRELDAEIAAEQIHSLIKGNSFWPQLMRVAPPLSLSERQALANRTATLFLSHYQL